MLNRPSRIGMKPEFINRLESEVLSFRTGLVDRLHLECVFDTGLSKTSNPHIRDASSMSLTVMAAGCKSDAGMRQETYELWVDVHTSSEQDLLKSPEVFSKVVDVILGTLSLDPVVGTRPPAGEASIKMEPIPSQDGQNDVRIIMKRVTQRMLTPDATVRSTA